MITKIIGIVEIGFCIFGLYWLIKSLKSSEQREEEKLEIERDILKVLKENNPEQGEDKK